MFKKMKMIQPFKRKILLVHLFSFLLIIFPLMFVLKFGSLLWGIICLDVCVQVTLLKDINRQQCARKVAWGKESRGCVRKRESRLREGKRTVYNTANNRERRRQKDKQAIRKADKQRQQETYRNDKQKKIAGKERRDK